MKNTVMTMMKKKSEDDVILLSDRKFPPVPRFGPIGKKRGQVNIIPITYEEIESIRMIDLMGLDTEDVAKELNISERKLQLILQKAHRKIAMSLVFGFELNIQGGNLTVIK